MYGLRVMRRTFEERTGFPLKILEPGYLGGGTGQEELKILLGELKRLPSLRKRWGFGEKEKITMAKVQQKCEGV